MALPPENWREQAGTGWNWREQQHASVQTRTPKKTRTPSWWASKGPTLPGTVSLISWNIGDHSVEGITRWGSAAKASFHG